MNKKNETTAVLASVLAVGAIAGYLSKTIIDHDKIIDLKNKLRTSEFKTRIYRHSFEASLEEVPSDRVKSVSEKIHTDIDFELIIADQK